VFVSYFLSFLFFPGSWCCCCCCCWQSVTRIVRIRSHSLQLQHTFFYLFFSCVWIGFVDPPNLKNSSARVKSSCEGFDIWSTFYSIKLIIFSWDEKDFNTKREWHHIHSFESFLCCVSLPGANNTAGRNTSGPRSLCCAMCAFHHAISSSYKEDDDVLLLLPWPFPSI
jgi:hypothetical protein